VWVLACVLQPMHRCIHAIEIGADADVVLAYDAHHMLDMVRYATDGGTPGVDEGRVKNGQAGK